MCISSCSDIIQLLHDRGVDFDPTTANRYSSGGINFIPGREDITPTVVSKVELSPVRGAGYEPLIAILSESQRETSAFGGAVGDVVDVG